MKKVIALVFALVLPLIVSCGSLTPTGSNDGSDSTSKAVPNFGAVGQDPTTSKGFGAIMLSYSSEMVLPIVEGTGENAQLKGVLWTDEKGGSVAVYIGDDGLPTKTVIGNLVLIFSHWDTTKRTVDIAQVYAWDDVTKVGNIQTMKGVLLDEAHWANLEMLKNEYLNIKELSSLTKATCFPACETDTKNLAELLKFAGLGLSVGACGVATTVSFGAMALPCSGVIFSTLIAVSDESWLGDLDIVGDILSGTDYFQCATGDAGACVGAAIDAGSKALDKADEVLNKEENQPLFKTAEESLAKPTLKTEVVQQGSGILSCPNSYECEPGHYLPCFAGDTRKCGPDCMWGSCPVVKEEEPATTDDNNSDTGCFCDDGRSCSASNPCPAYVEDGFTIPGVCGCPVN